MPVTPDPNQLLLGRGKVYFDRFDVAGQPTGLRFLGEADKVEINPSVTTKDYFTMAKAVSTKLAKNVVSQTHEIDVQLREYSPKNLAIALFGESIALVQVAAPAVADEQLTAKAIPGYVYQTANRNISGVTAKTGATALVAGTDFEVLDAKLGLIHVLPGTTELDGTNPLSVSYAAAAIAATDGKLQVQTGTVPKIEGKIVFVGDPANGPEMDAEVWRVRFEPSGALALITDDYGSIPLKGEVMDDSVNHPTQPLYRLTTR
jgi:hypothetical protein